MTWRLTRTAALLVTVLMVLAGCKADVAVTVIVEPDSSGVVVVSVTLDREAIDRLEGIDDLRIADLEAAGWELQEPLVAPDGGSVLTGQKAFANPAELGAVLVEVSGPDGPYARLGLSSERSFASTTFRFEGALDGSVGVEAFADPGLAAALDGLAFGIDLVELEAELGEAPGSLVSLRLGVSLPGEHEGSLQTPGTVVYTSIDGRTHQVLFWDTTLAAVDPVPVLATSEERRVASIALAAATAGFALLFLFIVILWTLVVLRRRRRRRKAARQAAAEPRPIARGPRRDPDDTPVPVSASPESGPGPTGDPAAAGGAPATESDAPPPLELVVIGGPGVAFGVRDPVDDVVAFARAHGSMLEYPRIAEHYAQAELGRLSTAELWVAVGAEGDPRELDDALLGQYQPSPGLREFVARARERGYRVAYLGDGPAAWVDQLSRSFVLRDLVDPWVVSSVVGARTPDTAIFEALRRMAGVEPASCLLIDDRLRVLEAAHGLGFGTAWFSPSGRATEAPGHSIIRGFADLLSG